NQTFHEDAMRLPRMTTRRWMIAIVVVGLVTGSFVVGVRLKTIHDYFLSRAEFHTRLELSFGDEERRALDCVRTFADALDGIGKRQREVEVTGRDVEHVRSQVEFYRRIARRSHKNRAYHAAMADKYRHAARHPWLPVVDEPSLPE